MKFFRTTVFSILLTAVGVTSAPAAEAASPSLPCVFTSDPADLAAAREKFRAGDKDVVKTVKKEFVAEADKAMDLPPVSVIHKDGTPPSGDKHDYMSLSPYWWPDPSKPDGKPYVRKDGQYNPERKKYDVDALDTMGQAVGRLAAAYYFTGEEKYAKKAADLLRVFFLDEATRMNPNLKYAQFVPGYDKPRPSGIIEGGRLRQVVDADGLLAGSASWTTTDSERLKAWFGQLLQYILTSDQGKEELGQANNHGTWVHVQTATYALYTGDEELARKLLNDYKNRIDKQVKPDGSQPEELARTRSFHYSRFNLVALENLAMLGDRLKMDLWHYQTADGRSLRTAIDFLLPYTMGEKEWTHEQLEPMKPGDMIEVLRRAANALNEPKYEAAAKKLQENEPRRMVDLLFPAK